MSEETRDLFVYTTNGLIRITIGADWKITCGYPFGNTAHGGHYGKELRVYESKEQQRACITGVVHFWDASINVTKLRIDKTKKPEDLEAEIKALGVGAIEADTTQDPVF